MQETDKDRVLDDVERQEVVEALEAVLATDKFEAAPQMSAFLRYVVEQAADGNQNRIKAFTVAVDALGKPDNFDPQNDPVVRVLAGRLRAALAAYNDENPDALVVITMTPGSYVPSFERRSAENREAKNNDTLLTGVGNKPLSSQDVISENIAAKSSLGEKESKLQPDDTNQIGEQIVKPSPSLNSSAGKDERVVSPSSILAYANEALSKVPKLAIAAALAAVIVFGVLQERIGSTGEPEILAATQSGELDHNATARCRPTIPTVFISAIDYGNDLENSLNSLVSGVISESEHVSVYRILDTERDTRFWSEDYILTLTAQYSPDETLINMQLVEARTGRFVHSEVEKLHKHANNHLTLVELERITNTARSLVDINGPVVQDFSSRHDTD